MWSFDFNFIQFHLFSSVDVKAKKKRKKKSEETFETNRKLLPRESKDVFFFLCNRWRNIILNHSSHYDREEKKELKCVLKHVWHPRDPLTVTESVSEETEYKWFPGSVTVATGISHAEVSERDTFGTRKWNKTQTFWIQCGTSGSRSV